MIYTFVCYLLFNGVCTTIHATTILDFVCKTLESKWIACDLGSTCGLNDALCNDMVLGSISPNLIWTNT